MSGRRAATIIAGGVTFLAARFLWDARTEAAVLWGGFMGTLAYWLASQKPAPYSSPDLTPDVWQ